MAVLETIRVKFGIFASLIIGVGLLLFIVDPSSVERALHNMSSSNDVGVINGKAITYADFQSDVQQLSTVQEMLTGSSASSSEQQAQIRNAAWESLLYKYLLIEQANDAGIYVGNKEMVELSTGVNASPIIRNNPMFMDQDGKFSHDRLAAFIQQMKSQPSTSNLSLYWNYLQSTIKNMAYAQKYTALFTASMFETPLMIGDALRNNNVTSNVEYVMVPYTFAPDSNVVVNNSEIKKYYDEHKKFFKQQASRSINYVVFEVTPSKSDLQNTLADVEKLQNTFATTANIQNFLMKNSDRPYSNFWYSKGGLQSVSPEVESFVWGNSDKEVSPIITSGNKFYMARIMESKKIPDSVFVRHILLQESATVNKLADSLVNAINKGANFTKLVSQYSLDKNSAVDGVLGNLGWMTQVRMIPGFESIFNQSLNKPFILKSQYGTHVVEIIKETKPVLKKRVAVFEKEAVASKATFNDIYSKANTFATLAYGSIENYNKAVDSLGVYSHSIEKMLRSANNLGSIDNTKEVTRWAFDNKKGSVSQIITVDNNFFIIAAVTGTYKEGYASLEEVTPSIKDILYAKAYAQYKNKQIGEEIKGMTNLNAIASKLNTSVSTQDGVSFGSMANQSLDPYFVGAVSVAPLNTICGPIAGNYATYIYKVTQRNTGTFYTEKDAKNNAMQMVNYSANMLIPVMALDADVVNNMAKFY